MLRATMFPGGSRDAGMRVAQVTCDVYFIWNRWGAAEGVFVTSPEQVSGTCEFSLPAVLVGRGSVA